MMTTFMMHIESRRRRYRRRTCCLLLWKVWLYSQLLAVRIAQIEIVDSAAVTATSTATIIWPVVNKTTITTTTTAAFMNTTTTSTSATAATTTKSTIMTTSAPAFIESSHHESSKFKEYATLDTEVVERLIKEWAPVVWLAPEEKFMPLGVEEFLNHVHPADKSKSSIGGMPVGDNSKMAYLVTNAEIEELLENDNSFLYGRNPSESPVPIYAVVSLCTKPQKPHKTNEKVTKTYEAEHAFEEQFQAQKLQQHLQSTRAPYIPVSLDPFEGRNITVRRSSRLYPVFKRGLVKRDVSAYLPLEHITVENVKQPLHGSAAQISLTVAQKSAAELLATSLPPLRQTPTTATSNTVSPTMSADVSSHHVNNFIANLADNVRFTGASEEIDNRINIDYDSTNLQQKHKVKRKKLPSFHVTYWMFYPYSQGKTMCTLSLGPLGRIPFPAVYGFCIGKRKDIGSHIGDWEHMSLFFNGAAQPEAMYVSAHDAGAYYTYNYLTGSFEFKKQETRKGILQRPNFPKTVTTFNNHPVLFAAKGSHGLWTAPGKHRFVKVARLYDINGFGTPWNTWKSVDITYENLKSYGRSFIPSWLTFKGKWGNPKSKCHPFRRIGLNFCEYSDGPTGIPLKEPHFQCDATY